MKYIYLCGSDGSGKTSFLKEIENHYKKSFQNITWVWCRSPKIFSKPLMAFCRLIKLTNYITIDGVKYGDHQFYRSTFVSWIFPWLQLIDFTLKWWLIHRRIKTQIVLMDRFSLDTLADLMADTENYKLHKTFVGKGFINMIPKNTRIAVLNTSTNNIRLRKIDTLHDPQLEKRIKAYRIIQDHLALQIIDNNRDYNTVKTDIFNFFINEPNKEDNH